MRQGTRRGTWAKVVSLDKLACQFVEAKRNDVFGLVFYFIVILFVYLIKIDVIDLIHFVLEHFILWIEVCVLGDDFLAEYVNKLGCLG